MPHHLFALTKQLLTTEIADVAIFASNQKLSFTHVITKFTVNRIIFKLKNGAFQPSMNYRLVVLSSCVFLFLGVDTIICVSLTRRIILSKNSKKVAEIEKSRLIMMRFSMLVKNLTTWRSSCKELEIGRNETCERLWNLKNVWFCNRIYLEMSKTSVFLRMDVTVSVVQVEMSNSYIKDDETCWRERRPRTPPTASPYHIKELGN